MHHLPKAMQYRQTHWAIFFSDFYKIKHGESVPGS